MPARQVLKTEGHLHGMIGDEGGEDLLVVEDGVDLRVHRLGGGVAHARERLPERAVHPTVPGEHPGVALAGGAAAEADPGVQPEAAQQRAEEERVLLRGGLAAGEDHGEGVPARDLVVHRGGGLPGIVFVRKNQNL